MATTRRRVARGRGAGIPAEVRALFDVGCGWSSYGDAEVKRLWDEYGPGYLKTRKPDDEHGRCFVEMCLGAPGD